MDLRPLGLVAPWLGTGDGHNPLGDDIQPPVPTDEWDDWSQQVRCLCDQGEHYAEIISVFWRLMRLIAGPDPRSPGWPATTPVVIRLHHNSSLKIIFQITDPGGFFNVFNFVRA